MRVLHMPDTRVWDVHTGFDPFRGTVKREVIRAEEFAIPVVDGVMFRIRLGVAVLDGEATLLVGSNSLDLRVDEFRGGATARLMECAAELRDERARTEADRHRRKQEREDAEYAAGWADRMDPWGEP